MIAPSAVNVRPSLRSLQAAYDRGDRRPLEDLVRAWRGIQALPPDDPHSFFVLGGFHGEPFQLREAVDALSPTDIYPYWGGYCQHGNVLFPTWHRVYVKKLEEALQRIVPGVMLPFWDETDEASLSQGLPHVLTDANFVLDGQTLPNPLRSFVLPRAIQDGYWGDQQGGEQRPYFKPQGYETVRYPLSGLMGPKDRAATEKHNKHHADPLLNVENLNANVRVWLHGGAPTPEKPDPHGTGIYGRFVDCLNAPNYTVFSNGTSAEAWNNAGHPFVVPLEDPHNDIHLSVGGFDLPVPTTDGSDPASGRVQGANGDMGENNTAALDPIFFFHHCNVDRMFWLWQRRHPDQKLEIFEGYAGTSSSDSQGPTPEMPPGTQLGMDTPLRPFKKPGSDDWYTSADCVDVEVMGYTYGPGSLEQADLAAVPFVGGSSQVLVVRGMNRLHFRGSFVVTAVADISHPDGTVSHRYLGHHGVLSRWNVEGCANCQTHLDVVARFRLSMLSDDEVARATFSAQVAHRGDEWPARLQLRLSVEG